MPQVSGISLLPGGRRSATETMPKAQLTGAPKASASQGARARVPPGTPPLPTPDPPVATPCTPAQTVSGPDADGIRTTALACADTNSVSGGADHTQCPDPPAAAGQGQHPNNDGGNHLTVTVRRGLVLNGDIQDDTPIDEPMEDAPHKGRVVLSYGERGVTLVIEEGAMIDVNNDLNPARWSDSYGIHLQSRGERYNDDSTGPGGSVTIRLDGEIKPNQGDIDPDAVVFPTADTKLTWRDYGGNGNAIPAVTRDRDGAMDDHDVRVEPGATARIRQVSVSPGGNGIHADQTTKRATSSSTWPRAR